MLNGRTASEGIAGEWKGYYTQRHGNYVEEYSEKSDKNGNNKNDE
jgi:hypothetical protein